MTLSDFEKELVSKSQSDTRKRHHDRTEGRRHNRERHRHRERSSQRSSRHNEHDRKQDAEHRHKRLRRDDETEEERRRRKDKKRRQRREERHVSIRSGSRSPTHNSADIGNAYKTENESRSEKDSGGGAAAEQEHSVSKRDDWMHAPSSLDIDYIQRRKEPSKPTHNAARQADYNLKIHENELNTHLRNENSQEKSILDEPAQHTVSYTFGDAGSSWRMTRLKAVYRQAKESERTVEEIALERYGNLRDFDDAREEEIELDRRKMYGKDYVGKERPSGELFQDRKLAAGIHEVASKDQASAETVPIAQGTVIEERAPLAKTVFLDQTALNKLRAQMMKAKLKGAPNAAQLEIEYNAAVSQAANRVEPEVVVLNSMENRMLAGGRKGEVTTVNTKRGRERGNVEENEDMSIEDMVRQERRTKGARGGTGLELAERIAKDAKFDNDLDYMDENAEKLSKRVAKSEINLKNMAVGDFQKMNKILDACPLCHHEDRDAPPVAPIASLATRVYLTLPTEPEVSEGGACIVPIQHRINLLECDDDEWEEIRNYMKSLIRMFHDQGRDVIFYENAAAPHRKLHAALQVVPLPYSLGETAPAFFREAILSADEEWTQHRKLIDTLGRSKDGLGKLAFRRTLAREMPYFHVWFELDGGLGHVVEDANRWPKGDLFAREIIGGMLDVGPDVIKRQGRWTRNDRRLEGFKKRFRKFDWARVLSDG